MATTDLTLSDFSSTIEENDLVLIDFWAPWCGPCRAFGPIFKEAAERHEGVVFAKVNTEEEQELAGSLGIRSIPTLMIFKENILIFAQPGMLPAEALDDLVAKAQELDMDEVRAEIEAQKAEEDQSAVVN
jgi:thioredoxin 1